MGDIDTSSAKNFFGSLRNANNPNAASPPPPPAFAPQQSSFSPPPVRRVASNTTPKGVAPGPPPVPPPRSQEEEEETAGDWADVVYDYDSGVSLLLEHGIKELTILYTQSFL
jgi:abl interactor 2